MLEITTAERVIDTELERQVARRAARETPVMQAIYRAFVARGGPVPVEELMAALPGMSGDAVASELVALDADDLIQITAGSVEIAYPSRPGRRRSSRAWPRTGIATPAARSMRSEWPPCWGSPSK